jgi:hypothetical protein
LGKPQNLPSHIPAEIGNGAVKTAMLPLNANWLIGSDEQSKYI